MSAFEAEHKGRYAPDESCATDPKNPPEIASPQPRAPANGPQDGGMHSEASEPPRPQLRPRERQARALFNEGLEDWLGHVREAAASAYAYHDCHADSDLERVFLAVLMFIRPLLTNAGYGGPLDLEQQVSVRPQHQCGPYRIDFAVIVPRVGIHGEEIRIAVECDGHYFHDRTAKKAEKDKQRDRFLALNGWRVIRFGEAEVIKDPHACAAQVEELIESIIDSQLEASRARREGGVS